MIFLHVSHFKCLEENWKTKFDSITCQIVANRLSVLATHKTSGKRLKTKTRSHVLNNCTAFLRPCLRCWQAWHYLKGCWLCLFFSHSIKSKNSCRCRLDEKHNKRIPVNSNQNEVNDFNDIIRLVTVKPQEFLLSFEYFYNVNLKLNNSYVVKSQ